MHPVTLGYPGAQSLEPFSKAAWVLLEDYSLPPQETPVPLEATGHLEPSY